MDAKKLMVTSLVINVLLLAAGAFMYVDGKSQTALIDELTEERDKAIAQNTEYESEIKNLRGKLSLIAESGKDEDAARLKSSIDEKDAEISRLKAQLAQNGNRPGRPPEGGRLGPGGPGGNNPERMLEQFRENNPEAYERFVSERDRIMKEESERNANRERLMANIKKDSLTDKQREALEKYSDLVKTNEELRANSQNGNREDFMKMMQNQLMINSYMSGEIRDILVEQYVDTLRKGSGEAAAEEIKNIINATSQGFGGGFGGGPGRGFGGFGGGPGRGPGRGQGRGPGRGPGGNR